MEIKQYDQAKSAFEKMMTRGGEYTPDEFVRIGQMMLDAGLYPGGHPGVRARSRAFRAGARAAGALAVRLGQGLFRA